MIYDVDFDIHTYVEERNIFYILKLFFQVRKQIIIVGLSDIAPIRARYWSNNVLERFRELLKRKEFVFHVKKIIENIHLGWGAFDHTCSLDDFLEEHQIAKRKCESYQIFVNFDEYVDDDDDDESDEENDNINVVIVVIGA